MLSNAMLFSHQFHQARFIICMCIVPHIIALAPLHHLRRGRRQRSRSDCPSPSRRLERPRLRAQLAVGPQLQARHRCPRQGRSHATPLRLRGHLRKQEQCASLPSAACAQSAAMHAAQRFPRHHHRKDHRHILRRHASCDETASRGSHGGEQIARRTSAHDSGSTEGTS